MKERFVLPASIGEGASSAKRGAAWLVLTVILLAIVFLPILVR